MLFEESMKRSYFILAKTIYYKARTYKYKDGY